MLPTTYVLLARKAADVLATAERSLTIRDVSQRIDASLLATRHVLSGLNSEGRVTRTIGNDGLSYWTAR